jgi:hypothetical protein
LVHALVYRGLIGWLGFPLSSSSVAIPDVLERLRLPPRLAVALLALQGKLTHSGYASACPLRAGERSEIAPVLGRRKHASDRESEGREREERGKREGETGNTKEDPRRTYPEEAENAGTEHNTTGQTFHPPREGSL